jgi:hypothetical protein
LFLYGGAAEALDYEDFRNPVNVDLPAAPEKQARRGEKC